ncbi:MAG: aldo/keto reductase [Verrucomicrobia bacterium]|jgi:aryl-alcohol dehydrogenase-like predicted oxidoreductase|nr:aldo/keto reductase [Verrucomicrobiota bacterium]
MNNRRLGKSGLVVSEICMGTMTFGDQTDEAMAHRIMDTALDRGVNFFDAAEMYPVPPRAETFGTTEEIVGRWLKDKPRDSIILATKITGAAHGWFVPPVRHGMTALDRHQIIRAVEDSLDRLQTDYIDLYQTHWPDHGMRHEETLAAMTELKQAGKIRVLGCSNETCWGVMKNLWTADVTGLERMDTVQNNFSLINRRCENELAQICRKEQVSLLPYSPLGGGVLCGKYNNGTFPEGARFSYYMLHGQERQKKMASRFINDRTLAVVDRVQAIAQEIGMNPITLATAWTKQHDFVASTIIGASHVDQLNETLAAGNVELDSETMALLDQIETDIPNAMPEDGLRRL